MRENTGLYHGKRVDNGEWVEGCFVAVKNKCYIGQEVTESTKSVSCLNGTWYGFDNFYEVIPETVGQYIALHDKNGAKIFEGDIIKNVWTGDIHTVDWCVDCAVWVLPCITDQRRETTFMSYSGDDYEIIGNIHDNPELLEGGVEK